MALTILPNLHHVPRFYPVYQQMLQLNTHTSYLHEAILDYCEQLLATAPAGIDRAMYM
ncbi:putative class-III aminotransferase domain protein [Candidatus Erwinia dacicola]|uniref:Class-III aminotransferase domain protein n=1 Tax=Candidatus Erwinia dacicola TaxID=252393 RepID=A0A328TPR2_9GAMM|nr:putative class-III aminotransferase domain protein [Candidatus Erwinia dacicola]